MNFFFSKHRLAQALLLSLSVHIGLLLVFSISSFFMPSAPLSQQIDIQLDVSSPVSLASLDMNIGRHPRDALVASCGLTVSSLSDRALMACTYSPEISSPLIRFYTPPELPWEAGGELMNPIPSAYPMKITLQKGLQTLFLTEDGSALFKPLTDDMTSYTPIFPDSLPRLSFRVTVDLRTGRITESHSEKEFTDERLQHLSEALLKELRFQPQEGAREERVQGELILQFATTFEGLAKQMKNPEAFL